MRKLISSVLINILIWHIIFVVHVICEENVSAKVSHSAATKFHSAQVKVDSNEDGTDGTNSETNISHRRIINVGNTKAEHSDEDDKVTSKDPKETKYPGLAGVQRRHSVSGPTNSTTKRDSQLLLLLAARRRQLLTERLTSHLATLATFAQKPAKHNVTSAQLEIRDFNNTVIRRISLPDINSSSPENRFKNGFDQQASSTRQVIRVDSFAGRGTTHSPDTKSSEVKSVFNTKALQEAKLVRAGYLNSRRKPLLDMRFGHGTRKPLIDLSVISHETYGIPEYRKDPNDKLDSKEAEAILDPDEEFQVDESNHGIYLLNYSTNNSMIQNPNETIVTPISDPEFLNMEYTTIPNIVESKIKIKNFTFPEIKENIEIKALNVSVANDSQISVADENKATKVSKIELPISTKQVKTDVPPKDSENNTLFLSDELYNHFRPLESELAVEDMAPFLFFGQKITMAAPKDNVTSIQLTPTKPTLYVRPQDKKRGTYRPATEKIKALPEENEDEINENMDVSVVKNVIEKNKIRNTIKMPTPLRHGNLVNAYRKQVVNDSSVHTTTAQTIIDNSAQPSSNEETKDSLVRVKDTGLNRTSIINLRNGNNRTYYNFRRKPAKLVQLNDTVKEAVTTIAPTTPLPSTVVYTAVVTSVSVTSSIKGQNKTDANLNSTLSEDVITPKNDSFKGKINNSTEVKEATVIPKDYSTTEKSLSTTTHRIQTVLNESSEHIIKSNETAVNKYRKKPDRIRPTNRPRIRFTPLGKVNLDNVSQPSPTPFILYSEKSAFSPTPKEIYKPVNIPLLPNFKYRTPTTTTERTVKPEINSENPLQTETIKIKSPYLIQPPNNRKIESTSDGVSNTVKCSNGKINSSECEEKTELPVQDLGKDTITESNIFKISKELTSDTKIYNSSDVNNSYFYISTVPVNPQNITPSSIGVPYEDNLTTELSKEVEIHLLNISSPIVGNPNISLLDKKDPKEVLQRRNGDVLIEMEKTNMATYILAGLSFLPITIIIMFVLRHVFLKKAKDIDTDYEGYFQDSTVKKETQITTVARPPIPPPTKPDEKWEFPRNKLRLQTLLGQGNFGQVWKAEADDLTGHDGLTRLVAVKTIKETASQKEKQELFHEICIMQKIGTHPNVVTLLACCTEQEPYLLIMEYVMCGKLLTYLRDRRSRLDRFQMPLGGLTSRDLTVFAYCVARGMDYLASKGIVHRDLAARNVLVDHNKLCKIADFGMSREMNPVSLNNDDKTCKPQRNALPVRWMAPEALLYSVYNHETDVWAYGVLLWEIVTLGSTPYATMSGREVLHMVTEGYRLERPAHCKPHLYQTMHACWHADPTQRPPFSEIKRQLSELLENEPTEGNYVDLESFYQDSSVYSDPSAIIENDGGISVEYSSELSVKLRKDELPKQSFHSSGTNLQRNFSSGNLVPRNANLRSEVFSSVRGGSHTTVGGFGIMDGGFSGRDGNFCERKATEKLSGTSFHREREINPSRENGHPGNSLISRNSFNGIGNQGRSGIRAFITKSGSSRSKRISEFECDI